MSAYWDVFIEDRMEKDTLYVISTPINRILEDFYHYLEAEGKIKS